MTRLTLTLISALCLAAPALAESTSTTTGAHGATIVTTRDCDREAGVRTCLRESTITALNGAVATRDRLTVATRTQITSTLSGTRFNGTGFSRTTVTTR